MKRRSVGYLERLLNGLEGGATSVMRVITEELPEDLS